MTAVIGEAHILQWSEVEAADASDLSLMRTLSFPSLPLFLLSTALSMGPVGCSGDDTSGDSESQESATTTTTTSDTVDMTGTESTGSTSGSTSGSASNSASASGSTSDSTTTESTSGATTGDTDGDTTAGASPELIDSCEAACATFVECAPEDYGPLDECIALCIEDAEPSGLDPDPDCESGSIALNQCYANALCEDLESLETCSDEEEAVDEACAITECTSSEGGNEEGTECSFSQECIDSPTLELNCDTELCECFEGGEKTGECATEGNLCADPGSLYEFSFECCGW